MSADYRRIVQMNSVKEFWAPLCWHSHR